MIQTYLVSLFTGLVMGSATVFYIKSITEGMEFKKRMKIMLWVGVPVGGIMGLLAQWIGRWIA